MKTTLGLLLAAFLAPALVAGEIIETDICVFGGTSGGIAAAVQSARLGKSVVIAEASQHLGGLTTGGLGATDIGNKAVIGGIEREFYEQIARHYENPQAWTREAAQQSAAPGGGAHSPRPPTLPARLPAAGAWPHDALIEGGS